MTSLACRDFFLIKLSNFLQAQEADDEANKKKQPRKITGRCWMAENFPMSLKNLIQLYLGNTSQYEHMCRGVHICTYEETSDGASDEMSHCWSRDLFCPITIVGS